MDGAAMVENYISSFAPNTQTILQQIRACVLSVVPNAEECISYAIPTFKYKEKVLVHYAAFNAHIGFYATPSGHEAFKKELENYKQGKGSVQFPLNQPIPFDLIKRIAIYRKELIDK